MSSLSIKQQVKECGELDAQDILLAETALLLSSLEKPQKAVEPYHAHLEKIREIFVRTAKTLECKDENDSEAVLDYRLRVIQRAFFQSLGYQGDEEGFDNPENMNMFNVIDQRAGIPVALGILIKHGVDHLGWTIHGLTFPGHFLMRLEYKGARLIFDPFYDGQEMPTHRLRDLIKTVTGEQSELDNTYFDIADHRAILVRYQNNIKTRQITYAGYDDALFTVETIMWFAPEEWQLYFDGGVLAAKLEQYNKAENLLLTFIDRTTDLESKYDAEQLLYTIRNYIN